MPAAGRRAAASRTGAARAAFTVKQPAAEHGASLKTSAKSLRAALMPLLMPEYVNPRGVRTMALQSRSEALQAFEPEGLVPAVHRIEVLHGLAGRPFYQIVDRADRDDDAP